MLEACSEVSGAQAFGNCAKLTLPPTRARSKTGALCPGAACCCIPKLHRGLSERGFVAGELRLGEPSPREGREPTGAKAAEPSPREGRELTGAKAAEPGVPTESRLEKPGVLGEACRDLRR